MLKFAYLAKKFPEFYAARKFAIVFTSTHHWYSTFLSRLT